ncbi:MAG: CsgG/HfaB family protein [Myxococcota bacterium]
MRSHPLRFAVVVALLALVAAVPRAGAAPIRVSVLYFDNHTGDPAFDEIGKGLADMLVTDLAGVSGLELVERSRLEAVLAEQSLQKKAISDPATAVKIGKILGARWAITGALTAVAPELRVDLRMIDIQTGKVTVAEKVVGPKDQFFALEAKLVDRFVAALDLHAPELGQKVADVKMVARFGEGLDLADKGDDAAAAKRLGEVVAGDPQFTLAQSRYKDLLARLYQAKDKRKEALSDAAKALVAKADKVLADGGEKAVRRFGYRMLRGMLFATALSKLGVKSDDVFAPATFPGAKLADAKQLVASWLANQEALVAEMKKARAGGNDEAYGIFADVDDADQTKAEELGTGPNPHRIAFASPQTMLRDIGAVLCRGHIDVGFLRFDFAPAPRELDPAWQARALAAFEQALVEIPKDVNDSLVQRETIRTHDEWAECLVAMGRKVEAVAKWQAMLDRFPTAEEFGDLEHKVKAALGIADPE